MTTMPDLFAALAAPFDSDEVKLRTLAGRQLHYITARTVMNRLDDVMGPENWWDEFLPMEHSVICKLTIRLPDGETITKVDAGGFAGMADPGDDDKSGYADAFKRAAVKFGIGRYLYRDGIPRFARDRLRAPQEAAPAPRAQEQSRPQAPPKQRRNDPKDVPQNGRAFFAWLKKKEEEFVGLIKHMIAWGKRQDLPERMVDWDGAQAGRGFDEACRKMAASAATQYAGRSGATPMSQEEADGPDDGWEGRE